MGVEGTKIDLLAGQRGFGQQRDREVVLGVATQVLHDALRLRVGAVAEVWDESVMGGEPHVIRRRDNDIGDHAAFENYLAELRRTRQFARLIAITSDRLEALYGDTETEEGQVKAATEKRSLPPDQLRQQKQALLDRLQREYAQLKAQWGGDTEYNDWFARSVNNAKLNSVAAYYDLMPAFERLLEQNGGDLERFYQAVERLADEPKAERQKWLRMLNSRADGSAALDN